MPSFLYDIEIFSKTELLVKAVVIDTQRICDEGTKNDQNIYLEKVVKKLNESSRTNAHYFMVLGHYHVWSIGESGPKKCMVKKLRHILHEFNVDGYFSGHEHSMEHFSDNLINKTVEHLVFGTASQITNRAFNRNKVDSDKVNFFWEKDDNPEEKCKDCSSAVVYAYADREKMKFRLIDTNQNELYNFEIKSRKSKY